MKLFGKPKRETRQRATRLPQPVQRNRGVRRPIVRRGGRLKTPYVRGYAGAANNNMTFSMAKTPVSPIQEIRESLAALRARSRELGNNDPHAKMFNSQLLRNVVGPDGIRMRPAVPRSLYPKKGKKPEPDKPASQAIREAWDDWSRRENCDFQWERSWLEIQQQVIRTAAEDGEVFAQKIYGKSAGKYGFALMLIDPERLDLGYNEELRGGRYICMGIEFDKYGRRLAYHFLNSGSYGNRQRVEAKNIIHVFWRDRIDQLRGVPWSANILLRNSHLNKYQIAALRAAWTGATNNPAIQATENAGPLTPGSIGNDIGDDDNPVIDIGDPGDVMTIPYGWQLSSWDPVYPAGEYPGFIKSVKQDMAVGYQVNYPTLSGDLEGVNYSSLRHGNMTEQDYWKVLQGWLVGRFMEEVREEWLHCALIGQQIKIGTAALDYANFDRYNKVKWRPRRWLAVDEMKNAKANETNLANGTTSHQRIADEQGIDIEDIIAEEAEYEELRKAHGLLGEESTEGDVGK